MRCSLNLLVSVMILAASGAALAQSPTYNVGTPLSQEEIRDFDFMLGPEGNELPPDRGLDLSVSDLLKNFIFRQASDRFAEAEAAWQKNEHALGHGHAPGRCLAHDPAPRRRPRHEGQDRLPHLPRNRDHSLSRSRRHARKRAEVMAAHESPRTTKLYDRTGDEITLDEVQRIAI